jgi:hypothetical protein
MIFRLTFVLALVCGVAARADDSFTKSLSASDFESAGLGKLTPEELARLDALVRGQQTGAVAKATEATAKAVTVKVREQVQAEDRKAAQKQAPSASFVDRFKVILKPGTEIGYTALDAVLAPPFSGWEKGTVLTLTNGQLWTVTESGAYWAPKTDKPIHVRIVPGALGSFFMEIEHGGTPRVKFLGNTSGSPADPPAQER